MEEHLAEFVKYAPIIIVVLMFFYQNNIFVKPEKLEEKHRKIIEEVNEKIKDAIKDNVTGKYVEVNAYKEFQNHIYSELEKVTGGIEELKAFLMKRRKDD